MREVIYILADGSRTKSYKRVIASGQPYAVQLKTVPKPHPRKK
jgi:hypothetical protein